ncbi:hypothetical protein [Kutzneria sp. 744]|uniref:hypothetical protein n=1 Tax=Kutzneria sp. (strain 744) TaxID=345341 RepID=UPI0003EEB6C2|nr:hypothetical protein [Kutzneria sp. 744]EWM19815.1 hypothetical protein KUTG_10119 [Kutzneria sp. 744]
MPEPVSSPWGGQLVRDFNYILAVASPPHTNARRAVCSLPALEERLATYAAVRRRMDLAPDRVIHCALPGQDPLPYGWSKPRTERPATCADLGWLWRAYLGQGLTVTTAGSHGLAPERGALASFAAMSRLVSSLTLRVEITGVLPQEELDSLAEDVRILRPLWTIPAVGPGGDELPRKRFQIQIVHVGPAERYAHNEAWALLYRVDMPLRECEAVFHDPTRLVFQQRTPGDPTRAVPGYGYGIRGEVFAVHADGVTIENLRTGTQPHASQAAHTHLGRYDTGPER